MDVRLSATALGLFLTSGDMFLCLKDERELIWGFPTKFRSPTHCLYFLTRYFAILTQICDVVTATYWMCKYVAVPARLCYIRLVCETVVCWIFVILLQMVLMLRVYALYKGSQQMGAFLGLILLGRIALGVWSVVRFRNIPASYIDFNFICLPEFRAHCGDPGVATFLIGELATQGIMLCLTMFKTYPWALKDISISAPDLLSVLNRDALLVFITVFGTLVSIIVATYQKGLGAVFVYPLFISVVSCAGCRLVLHLQRLARRGSSANEAAVFTDFNTSSTWDVRTHELRTISD
ncbi:hypothetical protein PM082_001959 [Marasmius tenuissimus]|nr:hypothetical protein PM082_015520 [Marasmius tenuissimus]KAJ8077528.1 hypothetical protein PM082_001959 [Marasmius tenuissimus]